MGSFLDVLNMLGNDALKRNVFGNILCIYIDVIYILGKMLRNVGKSRGGRIWRPSGAGVLFAFSGKKSVVCPQLFACLFLR